jgi:hypothetical protein
MHNSQRHLRRAAAILVATATVLFATSPAFAADASIRGAAKKCHLKGNLADGGRTISFDTAGDEDYGVGDDIEDVACVLLALRAPSFIVTEIDNTRALDGMQRDGWRKLKASWTYHPDNGLSIVIHE